MLASGPFRFRKPLLRDVCDVFRQSYGIFLIHCEVVHAEDFELEDRLTESVPHYIVYNAGTRVLFLYPEVLVIKDEDIHDVVTYQHFSRGFESRRIWFVWLQVPARPGNGCGRFGTSLRSEADVGCCCEVFVLLHVVVVEGGRASLNHAHHRGRTPTLAIRCGRRLGYCGLTGSPSAAFQGRGAKKSRITRNGF